MKLRSPRGDSIREVDSPSYQNPWLIGYWVNKRYEGRGYVTEACQLMMDYGVKAMGVDCYLAEIDPENDKSFKVVDRLGFSFFKKIMIENGGVRSDWPEIAPLNIYVKIIKN